MTEVEQKQQAALYAALGRAVGDCAEVARKGEEQHHGYKYAKAEDVIKVGREALAKQKLALIPVMANMEIDGDFKSVGAEYMLVHADGGHFCLHRKWPLIAFRGRDLDKSMAAVLTTMLSYVLRQLLLMPIASPEVDSADRSDSHDEDDGVVHMSREATSRPSPRPSASPPATQPRQSAQAQAQQAVQLPPQQQAAPISSRPASQQQVTKVDAQPILPTDSQTDLARIHETFKAWTANAAQVRRKANFDMETWFKLVEGWAGRSLRAVKPDGSPTYNLAVVDDEVVARIQAGLQAFIQEHFRAPATSGV